MQFGKFKLLSIETGRFALDGGAMFGVVPKNLWMKVNPPDEQNRIDLALRSLLIAYSDKLILIDTGIGTKFDNKFKTLYKINTESYNLEKSLKYLGLTQNDVTDVILTHLHFDHTGGTTYLDDNQLKITFPNASHYIQEEQWDWALQPSQKDRASFLKDNYFILEETNQIIKLNGSGEIFPGIETMVMYGHTSGMQLVKISDHGKTLLYCSDLIPTSSHVPLPWIMAYDNNPLKTLNEKNFILQQAVKENWILFFEHDPVRQAATVIHADKGYTINQDIRL